MNMLERAISLATNLHAGQTDKVGQPYILHPIRVMLSMNSEDERVVAVLHDILEDTCMDEDSLRNHFPDYIVDAVVALSNNPKDPNYERYLNKVSKNSLALRVKRADINDNSSPIRLYQLEPDKRIYLRKKYMMALNILDKLEMEKS